MLFWMLCGNGMHSFIQHWKNFNLGQTESIHKAKTVEMASFNFLSRLLLCQSTYLKHRLLLCLLYMYTCNYEKQCSISLVFHGLAAECNSGFLHTFIPTYLHTYIHCTLFIPEANYIKEN